MTKKDMFYKNTLKHIETVKGFMLDFADEIVDRGAEHDKSKLLDPEKEHFKKYTPLLKDSTYGSPEYHKFLENLKPALDHHYAENRHHPEHFEHGIEDMTLIRSCQILVILI